MRNKALIAFLIVSLVVGFSVSLLAQLQYVDVVSDATTNSEGNLNRAVANVINQDPTGALLSRTVFRLEHYGYYILTSTISTPTGSHLRIEGPTPGTTQDKALPMILWTSSGNVNTNYNFEIGGDLTMKNVWILCARTSGAQVGTSIVIKDNPETNQNGRGQNLVMDGCIVDYMSIGVGGGAIIPACKSFRGRITNTYFRNMTDPHYRYYGRPVSWTYQSTEWHTDTLIFENCTFANCGYAYMQEPPCYGNYVWFNHCTFFNTIMFTLESNYWWWLNVTNCLFFNCYLYGWIPSGDAANMFSGGGTVQIDSVKNFGFSVPFTDSRDADVNLQRHILFAHNSYGHDRWYIDFLNNNPYWPTDPRNRVHRMPMMSGRTYGFFHGYIDGQKKFPYMNMANIYPPVDTIPDLPATYNPDVDPGFILPPTNIDSLKQFLLGRWYTGKDVNWAYNPEADIRQEWPLAENLAYTNQTLKTAAMNGFPLGDLYWWWGPFSNDNKYNQWKAQADQERAFIKQWLETGIKPSSVVKLPGIPTEYELSQNYPNPFNPTTDIKYAIPVKSNVSLKVYNTRGQLVTTLFEGQQEQGNYSVKFDASHLSSGVYFYTLKAGNVSLTKKLVLMK